MIPADFELQIENDNSNIFYNVMEEDIPDDPVTTITELVRRKQEEQSNFIMTDPKHKSRKATKTMSSAYSTTKRILTRAEKLDNFLS